MLAFAKPEEGFAEMPVYAGAAVAANRRVAAKRRQAQQAKRDSFNFVQETLKRFDVSKSGARRRIACCLFFSCTETELPRGDAGDAPRGSSVFTALLHPHRRRPLLRPLGRPLRAAQSRAENCVLDFAPQA